MIYIEVPDKNDSISYISIKGVLFGLRFTYNEKYDYWSLGIYDANNNPIVSMTKIVPNFPIFNFYTESSLPNGIFGCISKSERVGRNSFLDGDANIVYIANEEVEE